MPWVTLPNTNTCYALICFDENGEERTDDSTDLSMLFSARVLKNLAEQSTTDVFLFSHGWKGDVNAAIDQYNRWIGALESCTEDHARMQAKYPNFRPLYIGLHWPSLPFGDERIGTGAAFTAVPVGLEKLVNIYAERLGNTPEVRAELTVIFEEARTNAAAEVLTDRAREAYIKLDALLNLDAGKPGDPEADREPFDPDRAVEDTRVASVDFGGFDIGGAILSPLRQLSFWVMKKRALTVGESGMHSFVKRLQQAAPTVRIHLMGHSFGCIVMSSILGGPNGNAPIVRPVDSCVLVQGAMSLWSYSPDMPVRPGIPGYFHQVLTDGKVSGPMVVTISKHDTAVGSLYPLAAGVAGQVQYGAASKWPEYGAIGAFGVRGIQYHVEDLKMLPADEDYVFAPSTIYNLESSQFIWRGDGLSGAHSDIDGPEVAHTIWQAALV